MPRYHATSEGNIPFTAAEEIVADAEAAAYAVNFLPNLKATLVTAIDTHIATIYAKFQRFDNEYKAREQAARDFKAANYQGNAGLYVSGYASYTGITPTAAADIIIGKADALKAALSTMSDLRMKKNLITSAATAEAAQTIHDEIITAVNAIDAALA